MTDIRLPLGGVKFSVRVAILCVRGNKVLATSEPGISFWYLPGGALKVDEDAASGAAREWLEETGRVADSLCLLGVVETLFKRGQERHHEIGFYFRLNAPPELPQGRFSLLDKPDFFYDWIPLSEWITRPIHPLAAHSLLHVPADTVRHIVNRE